MVNTLHILDTIQVASVDSVQNVVMHINDAIPVMFKDETPHDWWMDNGVAFVTSIVTAIVALVSIAFNIYQFSAGKKEREQARKHERDLRNIDRESKYIEQLTDQGLKEHVELYEKLIKIDNFVVDTGKDNLNNNQNYSALIKETKNFIRTRKVLLDSEVVTISNEILRLYNSLPNQVDKEETMSQISVRLVQFVDRFRHENIDNHESR